MTRPARADGSIGDSITATMGDYKRNPTWDLSTNFTVYLDIDFGCSRVGNNVSKFEIVSVCVLSRPPQPNKL